MKRKIFRKCSIEGCEREVDAKGLCSMHYYRIKKGIKDMRPERLYGWAWNKRPKRNESICMVEGCEKTQYAKGYCQYHWRMNKEFGSPIYKKREPNRKCSVESCENVAKIKGLCHFHYNRFKRGTELERPKGIDGELNPRWNGGVAQYQNHSEMKRIRKQVLMEENYTCYLCGKPTKQIHHLDGSKSNHDRSNLRACCVSCNLKMAPVHQSKYTRAYGKNLTELSKELSFCIPKIVKLHKSGELKNLIVNDEVKAVLF